MKPISKTVADNIAVAVREDILSGAHPPGEPLRQDMLAERYDVSRIPVREALLQLDAQGLVKHHPHRGVVVRPMSADEAEEVFHLRALIEPGLITRRVRQADDGTFDEARRILKQMNEELTRLGPTALFGTLHRQFHRELYHCEGREQSVEFMDRLYVLAERYVRIHLRDKPAKARRAIREHGALLKICRARKAREAARAVKSHIEAAAADLIEAFEAQAKAEPPSRVSRR